jgi:hypothetical protein
MTLTTYTELEQGTDEWLAARCGIVTASVIAHNHANRIRAAVAASSN